MGRDIRAGAGRWSATAALLGVAAGAAFSTGALARADAAVFETQ